MKEIDLHGVKHQNVTSIIIDACAKYKVPFVVITGKSAQMIKLVDFAVSKFGFTTECCLNNPGRVIVDESR